VNAVPTDSASWASCDGVLADGATVHIRPIAPSDAARLVELHGRLSDETIYMRFFSFHPRLGEDEVAHLTTVDGVDRMALVATLRGDLIGVSRYDRSRDEPEEAEAAFLVEDAHQGRGLGTLLLEHLAVYARGQGIRRFVADTLPQNTAMQAVFRNAGFVEKARFDNGVVRVELNIEPTTATTDAIERRWADAAAASIGRVLRPRSIAVIGAGRARGGVGHELLRNILAGGFNGPVYPVNPSARSVASVPAFPSLASIEAEVDLAVISLPAAQVPGIVDACAAKGVKGLVVVTAGFAELGADGADVQADLVRKARGAGMRMVGPNCMGVVNTDPDVSMNATFASTAPLPGRVALSSQSGGLGIAVLEEAQRRGLGLSSFVSVGNKADISGNDLLRYWQRDGSTDVILLYLESFGNPRRFARIAREVSRTKPIVAVKAGRSRAGIRAAASHTAALASSDVMVDALFHQTGVIRVDTLEEMFDVAEVLACQPVPAGRRVAILGNAGGPGILAADAAESAGLVVGELSASSQSALREFLPAEASVANPVDMVASATAASYLRALEIILGDDGVDAVLTIFAPTLLATADDVAAAINQAAVNQGEVAAEKSARGKPIVSTFLGRWDIPEGLQNAGSRVPSFAFPEPAARALAKVCAYGDWRGRPDGKLPGRDGLRSAEAEAAVQECLAQHPDGAWLPPDKVETVLAAYSIPAATSVTVGSASAAAEAAARVGLPVALKAVGPLLVHKTDVDGVELSLKSPGEVSDAFDSMKARIGDAMTGALIQAMVPAGVETVVGLVQDHLFGPLIMFGSGGTAVEVFRDQAFRCLPLSDLDASELVRATKGSALLGGYRGSPPVDIASLEALVMRVAQLAEDLPEIAEMDLNPVVVSESGAVVVDAKIRVEIPPSRPDPTLRRL
jgi:acetyl coenzyme A synthetase (ADP forming)-like protein